MTIIVQEKKILTAEEYLRMERLSLREKEGKHEFFNHKLIFMAGASNNHNLITKNLVYTLEHQIRQKQTKHLIYAQNMRVISHLPDKNYFYPDIAIVENQPLFDDENKDILTNPILTIEILSDTTEGFDRGDKFKSYRNISTLNEYILVSQEGKCIEQFYKNASGNWEIGHIVTEGTQKMKIVPFELSIEQVYYNM